MIGRFKREEYPRIAVSVGMLDTGFDCPGVVNIVFCRPTGSEILYKHHTRSRDEAVRGQAIEPNPGSLIRLLDNSSDSSPKKL